MNNFLKVLEASGYVRVEKPFPLLKDKEYLLVAQPCAGDSVLYMKGVGFYISDGRLTQHWTY